MESDGKILVNLTRGSILCEQLEVADRPARRMRGLLGRDSLAPGEGMLLQRAPSIHTAFMRFAIDALFMDGTLRVTKIVEQLRPWRIAAARRARAVLELPAGEVGRRAVSVGDQLGVVEVTDRLGAVLASPEWRKGSWPADAIDTDGKRSGELGAEGGAQLRIRSAPAVRAPKVLLVGTDRRFRSVAAALLTQRGCAVTLGERTANLAELSRREAADVVVLDAGPSLTAAAHAVAQVEALDPPIGIVVVGDHVGNGFSATPVIAKWGSFDELYGAIELARPSRTRRASNVRSS